MNDELLADKDSETYRHQCEVDSVVRMYRQKGGDAVKSYLLLVEKHRGSDSAQRLRNEALKIVQTGEKNEKPKRY